MEVDTLELTIEDILCLHRGWIRKLFIEDRKTEVEIVEQLRDRRLRVTLEQLRRCLQEWDLMSTRPVSPSTSSDRAPEMNDGALFRPSQERSLDAHSVSDEWELVKIKSVTQSPSRSHASSIALLPASPTDAPSIEFDGPDSIHRSAERTSPSLPTSSSHKRKSSHPLERPKGEKLKVTCHHGEESHAIEMTLGVLAKDGPSLIETYVSDNQRYERLAVGLDREPDDNEAPLPAMDDEIPVLSFRKSGVWSGAGNNYRAKKGQRVRRKGMGRKDFDPDWK